MATLRDEGFVTGWRDELYPVAERFGATPAFLVERAAAGYFGIKGYGVHVNGYVQMPDGSKKMVRAALALTLRFCLATASSRQSRRTHNASRGCTWLAWCDVRDPEVRRLACVRWV
jgi:hypothetical protein